MRAAAPLLWLPGLCLGAAASPTICHVLKLRSLWGLPSCCPDFLCVGFAVQSFSELGGFAVYLWRVCKLAFLCVGFDVCLWRVCKIAVQFIPMLHHCFVEGFYCWGIAVIYLKVCGIIAVSLGVYIFGRTVPLSTLTEIKP
jgi:hypothetical protein